MPPPVLTSKSKENASCVVTQPIVRWSSHNVTLMPKEHVVMADIVVRQRLLKIQISSGKSALKLKCLHNSFLHAQLQFKSRCNCGKASSTCGDDGNHSNVLTHSLAFATKMWPSFAIKGPCSISRKSKRVPQYKWTTISPNWNGFLVERERGVAIKSCQLRKLGKVHPCWREGKGEAGK